MTGNNFFNLNLKQILPLSIGVIFSLGLFGCGSDDDDDSTGYIQLYNVSANAPGMHLIVDKYDDDDFEEKTHSAVSFTNVSSRLTYDTDTYDIELAWQNEYNNQYDLETIFEDQLKVSGDTVEFIVIAEDIKNPTVLMYEIPVRDEDEIDDDNDDEVFNVRVLNMHTWSEGVDIYYSEHDATFNEAVLLDQTTYTVMADNQKIAQDDYIFYLTSASSDEVLYTSQDLTFPYAAEYIIVIRENTGAGSSPFTLDIVTTTSVQEYSDTNAEASYRIYNGIIEHELLTTYENSFDFHINTIDDSPEITALTFGQFSPSIITNSGDYSMSLVSSIDQSPLISHHLLPLNENSDKTIFFYLLEEAVDEDGDGDIDENGDGQIDKTEITVNSLVVNNSANESIYSHQMTIINLIDQDEIVDDFSSIKAYFVRSDEVIETADQSLTAIFANPNTVELLNNTYSVYIIGRLNTSDVILTSTELTLDEDSKSQFIILEKDVNSATGYKMSFANQTD